LGEGARRTIGWGRSQPAASRRSGADSENDGLKRRMAIGLVRATQGLRRAWRFTAALCPGVAQPGVVGAAPGFAVLQQGFRTRQVDAAMGAAHHRFLAVLQAGSRLLLAVFQRFLVGVFAGVV